MNYLVHDAFNASRLFTQPFKHSPEIVTGCNPHVSWELNQQQYLSIKQGETTRNLKFGAKHHNKSLYGSNALLEEVKLPPNNGINWFDS